MTVFPIHEALHQLCAASHKWAVNLTWDNLDFDSLDDFLKNSNLLTVFSKEELIEIWLMDDIFILFESQAEAEKVFETIPVEPQKISYVALINDQGIVASERI